MAEMIRNDQGMFLVLGLEMKSNPSWIRLLDGGEAEIGAHFPVDEGSPKGRSTEMGSLQAKTEFLLVKESHIYISNIYIYIYIVLSDQ